MLSVHECDTPSVTVAATVFLQYLYSAIINVSWLKFNFEFNHGPWMFMKPSHAYHL
jgi:hypothetical protein